MGLFDDSTELVGVADRPPGRPRGRILPCEHREGNRAVEDAPPDDLARVLAVAVFRLSPDGLRRVARVVIEETNGEGS